MTVIGDNTIGAVEHALRGLGTRADVRAHNLANLNTPGFRANRVDFESALSQALRTGDVPDAGGIAVTPDNALPNPNNNTVSLENEVVGMMKDNLMRDAMVNAFNFKVGVLRTGIRGQ